MLGSWLRLCWTWSSSRSDEDLLLQACGSRRSLAQSYRQAQRSAKGDELWSGIYEFCRSIEKYFEAGAADIAGPSWFTYFIEAVRARTRLDLTLSDIEEREALVSELTKILDKRLPAALAPINTSYARLQAYTAV
jgi:hypothetical protein